MLWFRWALLSLLTLAACSTAAPMVGHLVEDTAGQFDDVKLSFGKPDVKAAGDALGAETAADSGADADTHGDVAHVEIVSPDAELPDAPVAPDANFDASTDAATPDVPADTGPLPDVPVDTGPLPDIPGCVPQPETCNGVDDNCNGLTDESCDDGEPCTVNDACLGLGNCSGTLMNCGDGNACTADTCAAGTCQHVAYTCNDNNACTADTCDPASGCTHPPLTTACDDGNPCTTGDSCATGVCAGTPDTCDDSNACTTDACSATGGCTHVNNTATCDDGNPCTATDVCAGGTCVGSGGLCNDGNACTDDTCTGGVCGHANNTATCDDGNGCTVGDVCTAGTCVAGTPNTCDDGLSCTTDACSAGTCSHTDTCPAGNKCDEATNACIFAGCALPANACADGSQNRHDCGNARIIGRSSAKGSKGYKKSDTTCDSLNYFDGGGGQCYDTGYDHTYRIFLRKGESIAISYSGSTDDCWNGGSSDSTANFEVIQSDAGCGDPGGGSCSTYVVCSSNSSASYTAPAEGWYVIVADSESWGGDGFFYALTVKLNVATCQVAGCECP